MDIFYPDGCGDGLITVFGAETPIVTFIYPGAAQSSLIDVGTMASPTLITTSIAAPGYARQRSWLAGHSGPAVNPTLPASPLGPSILEWYLATTSDTNFVSLETTSGLLLSGPWTGGLGAILYLQADGAGGWIEGGRNEN